jgi:hypothetical protein
MSYRVLPLAALLTFVLAVAAHAEGKVDDYLTKEGRLTQTLEVIDVQGGFAGFTGNAWVVETDGKWAHYRVMNQKRDVLAKGELNKEQLAALAKELARYDAATLPAKDLSKGMANPHPVTVKYGKKEAALTLPAGEPLPKPDAEKVEGRYAGVAAAVRKVSEGKKGEEK